MTSTHPYARFGEMVRRAVLAIVLCPSLALVAGCDAADQYVEEPAVAAAPQAEGSTGLEAVALSGVVAADGFEDGSLNGLSFASDALGRITSTGHATVSSLQWAGPTAEGVAMPTAISLTPTGFTTNAGGSSRTVAFETGMRDAFAEMSAQADGILDASAARLADGRRFRDLSVAERLESLRQRGVEVEALGDGRYKLTRSFGPASGSRTSSSSSGGMEIVSIYDPQKRASAIETNIYMGGELVSEQEQTQDQQRTHTMHTHMEGDVGGTVEFSSPFNSQ